MIKAFLGVYVLIIFVTAGCALLPEGLMTLKRVGDSQKQIGRYLAKQEKLFDKMLRDVKNGRIKPGISQNRLISIYGEPVITKSSKEPTIAEIFLYRYPTEYFSSDKVYLYFDKSGKLVHLKYEPR